jgi:hypothetical protein
VNEALKGSVGELPELVRRQVQQALAFLLGSGGYDVGAMQQYLHTLSRHPFFLLVVFLNPDKTLFGIIEAKRLLTLLESQGGGQTFANLASLVNRGTPDEKVQLGKLPGFVPPRAAVKSDTNERDALQQMEARIADQPTRGGFFRTTMGW